jgi:hypothetical protein
MKFFADYIVSRNAHAPWGKKKERQRAIVVDFGRFEYACRQLAVCGSLGGA